MVRLSGKLLSKLIKRWLSELKRWVGITPHLHIAQPSPIAPPKFAVHPGWITSDTDGDRHYISFVRLVQLYHVPRKLCVLWNDARPSTWHGRSWEAYYHLFPRNDGNYKLSEKARQLIERTKLDEIDEVLRMTTNKRELPLEARILTKINALIKPIEEVISRFNKRHKRGDSLSCKELRMINRMCGMNNGYHTAKQLIATGDIDQLEKRIRIFEKHDSNFDRGQVIGLQRSLKLYNHFRKEYLAEITKPLLGERKGVLG